MIPDNDPRRTPARPDLAAAHLRGKIEAARYVEGQRLEVMAAALPLKKAPGFHEPVETEALRGEIVNVFEAGEEGWSWGQLETDGYVGWLPSESLAPAGAPHTHKLAATRSFAYPGPSMKLPNCAAFSFGSRFSIVETSGDFARTADNLYLWQGHLVPISRDEPDFVAVAERFLNVPYLWGGKTSLGIDCSGLVQLCVQSSGRAAPRDSDMQAAELGRPLIVGPDLSGLRRGDLVYWRGHCGIMRDETTLLHANGHHMMVASEDLAGAIARIGAKTHGEVTGFARL